MLVCYTLPSLVLDPVVPQSRRNKPAILLAQYCDLKFVLSLYGFQLNIGEQGICTLVALNQERVISLLDDG